MKAFLSVILATAFVTASFPASSQTSQVKPGLQDQSSKHAPGTGGASKPGTSGLPGSKSGPSETIMVGEGAAVRSPGGLATSETNESKITKQQDQSGVQGLPGGKSGPAERPPSKK